MFSASSIQQMSTPSVDLISVALYLRPLNIISVPFRASIVAFLMRQKLSRLYCCIKSLNSLCTDVSILFCSSRVARMRSLLCAPSINSARAKL